MSEPERTALLFVECQRGVIGDLIVLPALPAMGRLAAGARAAGASGRTTWCCRATRASRRCTARRCWPCCQHGHGPDRRGRCLDQPRRGGRRRRGLAVTIPTDATVGTPPEHHASVLAHSL